LLVVAAIVGTECFERVRAHLRDARRAHIIAATALAVVIGWSVIFAARDVNAAFTDEKAAARAWITQSIPAPSSSRGPAPVVT
jgi:Na+-driven multidrug efflux pump